MVAISARLRANVKHKMVNRSKNSRIKKDKTMDQQNQRPNDQDAEFQRKEAIRLANLETSGEATPPDLSPTSHRAGSPTSDENFDGTRAANPSKSLEDRDTNDGDANNEND